MGLSDLKLNWFSCIFEDVMSVSKSVTCPEYNRAVISLAEG